MSDITRYEQETCINFNEEENTADVYTCSPVMKRKFDKLCQSNPDDYKLVEQLGDGKTYRVASKKLISFRTSREKKIMSEEQKKLFLERISKNKK